MAKKIGHAARRKSFSADTKIETLTSSLKRKGLAKIQILNKNY